MSVDSLVQHRAGTLGQAVPVPQRNEIILWLPAGLGHFASQAMLVQALTRSQKHLMQVPAHLCCADCARASTCMPCRDRLCHSASSRLSQSQILLPGQRGQENTALRCSQTGPPLGLSGPQRWEQEGKAGKRWLLHSSSDSGGDSAGSSVLPRSWGRHKQKHPRGQMFGKEAKHAAPLLLTYARPGKQLREACKEQNLFIKDLHTAPVNSNTLLVHLTLSQKSAILCWFFFKVLLIKNTHSIWRCPFNFFFKTLAFSAELLLCIYSFVQKFIAQSQFF